MHHVLTAIHTIRTSLLRTKIRFQGAAGLSMLHTHVTATTTSQPRRRSTSKISANFTGSPEDTTAAADWQDADAKYGVTYMQLVLPETYISSGTSSPGTTVGHYGTGNQIFGT